jgi:FkbM family methyltransferase
MMSARWFPLLRTYGLRAHWLYDVCRIAGSRDFRLLFDVGANTGQTAAAMNGYFPGADIHSFEPVEETFRSLGANVRRLRNVHAHNLALGRQSGFLDIELQPNSEMNSLQFTPKAGGSASRVERVEIATLDGFCAERGIEAMDVLKTDAQGCDVDVLAGGNRMISGKRVPFVYAEVSFQPGDRDNTQFAALDEHLQFRGFRLFGFYEQFGSPGVAYLQFCNALYVNAEALRLRFHPDAPNGSP